MTQIFATLDAAGQPVELIPTLGFTTYSVLVTCENEAAWSFTPVGQRAAFEVNHPPGALLSYGSDDLERYGVAVLAVPATPQGKRLTGYTLGLDRRGQPKVQAATFEPLPPPAVPRTVSRMQAKLALHAQGLLDDVEAAVAAAPREVQIYWTEVAELHRDHAILNQMTGALGWTSEQVDDLFRAAAAIF